MKILTKIKNMIYLICLIIVYLVIDKISTSDKLDRLKRMLDTAGINYEVLIKTIKQYREESRYSINSVEKDVSKLNKDFNEISNLILKHLKLKAEKEDFIDTEEYYNLIGEKYKTEKVVRQRWELKPLKKSKLK